MKKTTLFIVLLVLTTTSFAADRNIVKAMSTTFADIAESVGPSVVTITSERTMTSHPAFNGMQIPPQFEEFFAPFGNRDSQENRSYKTSSLGSGTIISNDGYIVTNNHVIEDADDIKVHLLDERVLDAELIGTDPKTDIALIKVDATKLTPIELGDSDKIRVGEWVLAIGSPFSDNLSNTITQGIVSAKGRTSVGLIDYENFIQTDAAINPGNSGGALVDLDGKLIGVNTAIASKTGGSQGIGFSIPVNMMIRIIEDLKDDGSVTRAWIGVMIQKIDTEMAKTLGMSDTRGALVQKVVDDSPADKAGLKMGDVIITFDGKSVHNSSDLRIMVSANRPGEKKKLEILRNGKKERYTIKLGVLPEKELVSNILEEDNNEFQVSTITNDLVKKYNLEDIKAGVVVTKVVMGSDAWKKNVRPGNIVIKVGEDIKSLVEINDKNDYQDTMMKFKEGDSILYLMKRGEDSFFVALEIKE